MNTTTAVTTTTDARTTAFRAGAALAVAMGVGRFAFTPILPLMQSEAGLTVGGASTLVTANYVGYLLGAVVGIVTPRVTRSVRTLRTALVVLLATLLTMPLTDSVALWAVARLLAGVTSALVFVVVTAAVLVRVRRHRERFAAWAVGGVGAGIATSGVVVLAVGEVGTWRAAWVGVTVLAVVLTAVVTAAVLVRVRRHRERFAGWAVGGVGAGIATSGVVVLAVGEVGTWRAAWVGVTVLAVVLTAVVWPVRVTASAGTSGAAAPALPTRFFVLLFVAYLLEGAGYILAGTYLVAAVAQDGPGWLGAGAWVVVGLAAFPSSAVATWLGRRAPRSGLLAVALAVQAVGIALPSVWPGAVSALAGAVLFGGTFMVVVATALAVGGELGFPRAVALLTTGYAVGQIAGPLAAAPLLHGGFRGALLLGAVVVGVAALVAVLLHVRLPRPDAVVASATGTRP